MGRRDEGYSLIHMSAKQLREERKLWPQTLDNVDLIAEIRALEPDPSKAPISYRMLKDEYMWRVKRGIIAT